MDDFYTEPCVLQPSTTDSLELELARCLFLVAVLQAHCKPISSNHAIAIRSAPSDAICVHANILEIEESRGDCKLPDRDTEGYFRFQGEVSVCDDLPGFITSIDETTILAGATETSGIELAILISLFKSRHAKGIESEWNDRRGWHIGSEFCKTVQVIVKNASSSLQNKILRAIVRTIDNRDLAAVHAIRKSKGGGSAQRKRTGDNALAWRRDIDHEYHLHYWKLPDGNVELASVGPHNEFSIPE